MEQQPAQGVAQTTDLQLHFTNHLYRRDGLLCALLMAGCVLIAHPFVEMGFIDDWSYIKTTEIFAQTGHLVYNGWAAMPQGWQVLWGALFSKLFGSSFVAIRLSTLPVALASVYIFHQILIRFGISRGYAVFGTLALALSPVFMLLSATYMTDIHAVFCTLLCLYLCLRAVSAATDRSAFGWLCLAAVTNVAGGTVRQTAWLGVLIIVPSAVWLLRKRRSVFWGGVLLWLVGAAGVFACMQWFNHQPYFLSEGVLPNEMIRGGLKHLVGPGTHVMVGFSKAILCLLLLLFPILAAWLSLTRPVPRRALIWAALLSSVLLAAFFIYRFRHGNLDAWLPPWFPNVINYMGVVGSGDIPGVNPGPLHYPQRIVIAVFVLASALIFFLHLYSRLRQNVHLSQTQRIVWSRMFWLLTPYVLGYMSALMVRELYQDIFDRYLMTLQAAGILFLLRYYQDFVAPDGKQKVWRFSVGRFPMAGQIALLVFAYYAIAGTHDCFALSRARLQAAEEVRRAGVPRTAIQAGFEYDAWTQLEATGYINDSRIRIPRGAFHPVPFSSDPRPECAQTWFDEYIRTPAVKPRYFLTYEPLGCLAPSPFAPVTYHAWMPPFVRHVYVQEEKR